MFLVLRFQQFHAELARLSEQAASGVPPVDAESISRSLLTLLERQTQEAAREGGDVAVDVYRRAQYAMAALADEVFLHLKFEWRGRTAWRENLLEARLFNSRCAGEEVFARIDTLLDERDPGASELARVYLTVLALGFRGKYRGLPGEQQELADYRRRLYRFIYGRSPQAVHARERLVPQTYLAAIHSEREGVELPYLRPWVLALVLIVAVWLASSQAIWHQAVSELEPLVTQIRELAAQPPASASPERVGSL